MSCEVPHPPLRPGARRGGIRTPWGRRPPGPEASAVPARPPRAGPRRPSTLAKRQSGEKAAEREPATAAFGFVWSPQAKGNLCVAWPRPPPCPTADRVGPSIGRPDVMSRQKGRQTTGGRAPSRVRPGQRHRNKHPAHTRRVPLRWAYVTRGFSARAPEEGPQAKTQQANPRHSRTHERPRARTGRQFSRRLPSNTVPDGENGCGDDVCAKQQRG